jgi:dienelactone hydrolase
VAHPSFIKVPEDIEAIAVPGIFNCAETDFLFSETAKHNSEEILKKKPFRTEFIGYPGTTHGFAVRGDESQPQILEAKQKAAAESSKFLKEILG